ncbi:hypothetical protein FH609_016175 [Streptomyces sp. 3MP-14]|uniref:Peptidoglycan binding domain-containing protein n=1 Tax=Streptomyces mimosae TaxID=2586635 RepID=A0A5N6AA44_9ACTN|nr:MULTISPECIES: hypothetical protein [Streptomyces]KAB8165132.1 hypothetical protein FH607_013500 [Streptomyces mimosae]KAB8175764.1 hypothetical protein FH609_016175 [Streptomyces sp. 3MP-14]
MTTRARINIPGSRPIPPIVVRETVDEEAARSAAPPPLPTRNKPAPGARPDGRGTAGRPADGASGGADSGKKTSSWFEPKKPPQTGAVPQAHPDGPVPGEPPHEPAGPETPPGGHPQLSDTPAGGVPGLGGERQGAPAWFPAPHETPAAGTPAVPPQGPLPPRPVGPTTGPGSGSMTVPPVAPTPMGGEHPPGIPPQAQAPTPQGPLAASAAHQDRPGGPAPRPGGPAPRPGGLPPDEDPAGTTMDLGGPFPPAPPPGVRDGDPAATGQLPRPLAPEDTGAGPTVPPPGPRPPAGDEPPPAGSAAPKPAPRGRSKVKLLVIALVGVGVVAYGAGLFLNPEDVPKGTEVLGIDIGGMSTEDAHGLLDTRLDAANNEPLILVIDGQEVELKPTVAGLAVDTEATARGASGTDYSPVSVIGSLFGSSREAEAVFSVDREKLTVALEDLTSGAGGTGPVDGTVVFENGQAIGRAGQAGSAIDPAAAADSVEAAFRERAAGGPNQPVELPVTTREPLVGEEQVQQALEEFGEPAMSGWVWLSAAGIELPISQQTLSGVLSMEPSDQGNLQPVIDPDGLAELYGSTFDGVMIDAGSGLVEMTPEHAAAALIPVLREPAVANEGPDRRIAEVEGATLG